MVKAIIAVLAVVVYFFGAYAWATPKQAPPPSFVVIAAPGYDAA